MRYERMTKQRIERRGHKRNGWARRSNGTRDVNQRVHHKKASCSESSSAPVCMYVANRTPLHGLVLNLSRPKGRRVNSHALLLRTSGAMYNGDPNMLSASDPWGR